MGEVAIVGNYFGVFAGGREKGPRQEVEHRMKERGKFSFWGPFFPILVSKRNLVPFAGLLYCMLPLPRNFIAFCGHVHIVDR